jgi:hypothetical protein
VAQAHEQMNSQGCGGHDGHGGQGDVVAPKSCTLSIESRMYESTRS